MKLFINLSLKAKLITIFGLTLALFLAVCAFGLAGMAHMGAKSKELAEVWVRGTHSAGELKALNGLVRMKAYNLYVSPRDQHDRIKEELSDAISKVGEDMSDYDKTIVDDTDRKNFNDFKTRFDSMLEKVSNYIDLQDEGKTAEAKTLLMGPMLDDYYACAKMVDEIVTYNVRASEKAADQAEAVYDNGRVVILASTGAGVLISMLLATILGSYVLKSVNALGKRMTRMQTFCVANLKSAVEAMSRGDMTVQIQTGTDPLEVASRDEFGRLSQTFNELLGQTRETIEATRGTQSSLSDLVRQIQQSANQVGFAADDLAKTSQEVEGAAEEVGASMREIASASQQAARGASEVATGTTTQAQALSESTRNIQRLATSVSNVAEDAQVAAEAAHAAGAAATDGNTVVAQSMSGMNAIRETVAQSASVIHTLGESSQKIGTIVQTINEIAEQTNLLALNAAIEAARAGEAGRGFAVVADEVRKLAERSGGATREIGALIAEIQERTAQAVAAMEAGTNEVEAQTKIAENTKNAFQKIQTVIDEVNAKVEGIRLATNQMAEVSGEVSKSISEVAAVVEESSAAAEELSASAEEVSASVDTVAGAAQQQSAAASELVASSEQLQNLAQGLGEAVSSFKIVGLDMPSASEQPMLRAA